MAKRSDPQAEAIVEGRHDNPFGYLGMHKSASGLRVRTMLPGAEIREPSDVGVFDVVAAEVDCAWFLGTGGTFSRFLQPLNAISAHSKKSTSPCLNMKPQSYLETGLRPSCFI